MTGAGEEVDRLEVLDVPQSSIGAPLPHVLGSELSLTLVYLLEEFDQEWDGTTVRVVGAESVEPVAIVRFEGAYWWSLGPPNDEAISGHPLADKGLEPYSAYRVENSSWIEELARRNRVHPYHWQEGFDRLTHFIFVFHDKTFECAAEGFEVEQTTGSISSVMRSLTA